MNPKHLKLLDASRRLRYIPRLATNPLIRPLNVAEHSFGVATIAFLLLEEHLRLNDDPDAFRKAYYTLVDAVTHDVAEGVTGDVLYSTKRDNPRIAHEMAELEERISAELAMDFSANSDTSIVKASDMAELLMNLEEEISMGNQFDNIRAVWFFSLCMVWRFSVRMSSPLLKSIVQTGFNRLPDKHLYLTAAHVVLGVQAPWWRVIPGEAGEVYRGFKGIIERVSDDTAAVLAQVDADKRISWAILIEHTVDKARYFACRVNSNFEERVILYHVSGARKNELEIKAIDVIHNEQPSQD